MKTCTRCKTSLPSSDYWKNGSKNDGFGTYCKKCCKSFIFGQKKPIQRCARCMEPGWEMNKKSIICNPCFELWIEWFDKRIRKHVKKLYFRKNNAILLDQETWEKNWEKFCAQINKENAA